MVTSEYGMGFLIQPPKNPRDECATDKLIQNMNMTELRAMLCPKTGGNPNVCKKCSGKQSCQAGQRAVHLLEEAEKPFRQVWDATQEANKKPPQTAEQKEREELQAACESGNAWYWMMKTHGVSKDVAAEILSKLIRKFPGLAAEYGGSRRIMQRPREVHITSIAENAQKTPPQAASSAPDEPSQTQMQSAPEPAKNSKMTLAEKTRKYCEDAVASGDPYQFLLNRGMSMHSVTNQIGLWRKKYPELMQDIPKRGYRAQAEKRRQEEQKMQQSQEPDEITLEDFINSFESADNATETAEPEKSQEPKDPMLEMLEKKYAELDAEKKRLTQMIRETEEKLERIESQLDALAITRSVFGS